MASSSSILLIMLLLVAANLAFPAAAASGRLFNPTACHPSGVLHGPHNGHTCSECCKPGQSYPQYKCSPPVTGSTKAILTVNDFSRGGDGGAPSECDNSYHDNSEHVVALSTGWYAQGSRCGQSITISANGRSVQAKVVDECDSVNGCDSPHAFEPPCLNNIVDASSSVWEALGISKNDGRFGYMDITWSMHSYICT